jgi:hypothetical protein
VTYKTSSGLDDWIYCHLIHITRDYTQYSAIAILHTLQFTVANALGFSVFTSRIQATDLSQSYCHFNSHTKSSLHSLLSCHYSHFCSSYSEDSTLFNSSYPGGLAARTTQKTACVVEEMCLPRRCLTIDVLLSRGYACADMCLQSHCLAVDIYVTMSFVKKGNFVST